MKSLMILISFLISLNVLALSRGELDQLLLEKGTSIAAFEAQGLQLIMGERTGGGSTLQFASVEVIFTMDEAFLKGEIQNVDPRSRPTLGDLKSFQAGGRHIQTDQIIGIIAK